MPPYPEPERLCLSTRCTYNRLLASTGHHLVGIVPHPGLPDSVACFCLLGPPTTTATQRTGGTRTWQHYWRRIVSPAPTKASPHPRRVRFLSSSALLRYVCMLTALRLPACPSKISEVDCYNTVPYEIQGPSSGTPPPIVVSSGGVMAGSNSSFPSLGCFPRSHVVENIITIIKLMLYILVYDHASKHHSPPPPYSMVPSFTRDARRTSRKEIL